MRSHSNSNCSSSSDSNNNCDTTAETPLQPFLATTPSSYSQSSSSSSMVKQSAVPDASFNHNNDVDTTSSTQVLHQYPSSEPDITNTDNNNDNGADRKSASPAFDVKNTNAQQQQQQQQQQNLDDSHDYDDYDEGDCTTIIDDYSRNNINDNSYPLVYNNFHTMTSPSMSGIGLRERTMSQSSVQQQDIRDRTFSQNSVDQLESQQQYRRTSITTTTTNKYLNSPPLQKRNDMTSITPNNSSRNGTTTTTASTERQQQNEWLRSLVLYIQSIRVPIWIIRRYSSRKHIRQPTATTMSNGTSPTSLIDSNNMSHVDVLQQQQQSYTNSSSNSDTQLLTDDRTVVIYWIRGLDRVIFTKDSCCAQDVVLMGWKPPKPMWFFISGGCCDVIQLGILFGLHKYLFPRPNDTSLCWMIAFCISIAFRHTAHRYFVFGNYIGGYTNSLIRIYMGYSVTIVLSTLLNYVLNRMMQVNLFVLAVLTMMWTGVVNYFILKHFWNIGSNKKSNG